MKKRNIFAVFLLPLVTFGIYGIVWWVKTKNEMNQQGAKIPTAWLLIVPIVGIYWLYAYSKGVEQVTEGKISTGIAFLLEFFLGCIGNAIIQDAFNKSTDVNTDPATNFMVNPIQPASDPAVMASTIQPAPIADTETPTTMEQPAPSVFGSANEVTPQSDLTAQLTDSVDQSVASAAPVLGSTSQSETATIDAIVNQPVSPAPVEPSLNIPNIVSQPTSTAPDSGNSTPVNPTTA